MTIRSSRAQKLDRTFSSVVLPDPDPPLITAFNLPITAARRNAAARSFNVPNSIRSSIVNGTLLNLRIVRHGPDSDNGEMIAFTRDPSGKRESTSGVD